LAISILSTKPFGVDSQDAVFGDSPAREPYQASPNVTSQTAGILDIKAKLNGRCYLVDILASRSRRSNEMQFYLILMNDN
jgi:hypothetical protein